MEQTFDKKLKVVHLITLLELGGAQGNTIHTVTHLNPIQYDVHLWCGKGAFWDEKANRTLGNRGKLRYFPMLVRPLNPLFDLICLVQLFLALRKEKPFILHTHSSKAGILGRLAAFFARVPIVIHTYHGFGFNEQQNILTRWIFVFLEKVTAQLSSALVFVSKSNWATAEQHHIGDTWKYHLIRSGIPLAKFSAPIPIEKRTELKSQLGIPDNALVVTTVGAFKPQKNLSAFVDMAKIVHAQDPHVHFVIVGDGILRPQIESAIEAAQIRPVIHLIGWRHDMPEILAISHVFVLSSLWEGLPRALVEACVRGIPAVCYETDGVKDILSLGGGFLIPQGNLDGLTQAVHRLLTNSDLWKQKSEEARACIGKEYDINTMVHQQEDLYKLLLDRQKPL